MITIYYKKKRIYLIASIIATLFIFSVIGFFYFWKNPAYVSSTLLKLPYGLHRLGFPVSLWWISTVFSLFLGFSIYLLWTMLENKPVVTVSSEGVAVKGLPFIAWHLIDKVQITDVKGQKFVEIRLQNMHAYKKRLAWPYYLLFKLNDMVGDFHVSLPTMLTMNNEQILEIIKTYKKI